MKGTLSIAQMSRHTIKIKTWCMDSLKLLTMKIK